MKNKSLIFIFFLFMTIFGSKKVLTNEFIFETEEIKISNNANITKAFNGTVTSKINNFFIKAKEFEYNKKLYLLKVFDGFIKYPNENIEIIANNFEYDEKKLLFKAYGDVLVKDIAKNISIQSPSISFNLKDKIINSKNYVLIKDFNNDITINSKNISYNIKNKIINSKNETQIEDNIGNSFIAKSFFYKVNDRLIKINDASLTDLQKNYYQIDKAFIDLSKNKLIGKDISIDFNNTLFQNENEPRLKGNSITANKDQTVIKKGVFTTCKKNDNCPPWQFSAEEIKHDKNKKTINYKNAWLKLYDKPVFYFPKFFHPDPTVKRQSGLLMPGFKSSTTHGTSLNTPYYLVISDNKDITFNPRFYADDKILLQTEYREVKSDSESLLDFSLMAEGNSPSKSHFFSKTKKKINLENFIDSEISLNLQQSSNDTYLKTNKLKSPIIKNYNLLTSSLALTAYRDDLSLDINFEVYEDLNKPNNDKYEVIYPSYSISKQLKSLENIEGNFSFNSKGFVKNYNTNIFEKVAINDLIFNSNSTYTNSGLKNNYNLLLRNTNTDSRKSEKYKNNADFKIAALLENNISYPLKKEMNDSSNILKPKISLKFSPNNNKNLREEDRRIDVNNIFSFERLGSGDTVEGGTSITYGLDFLKTHKDDKEILGAKIANIFRFNEDSNLPINSSLGQKTSNIVGELNFTPNKKFNINYDFSLDENLKDVKYQLLNTEISINNFITEFEYLNQNNNQNDESYLTNKTAYSVDETKNFIFETRINKKTKLTEFYNLIYQYRNDCLVAAIEYNKDYYTDRDLKPEENIFLKLTIMPFGQTTSPNLIK